MQSSNIPSKIPLPFGYAAGSGYINPIPSASQIGIVNGRASLHDGFPPDTFIPVTSGGVPPFGGDFNGILNEITAIQQWQEAGGFFPFDSGFASTIGGYPKGAVIQSSSLNGLWVSTTENNSNNPDTTGTGWTSLAFEGLQSVAMSGTSITLTMLQSAYPIINITGTLTAASTVIIPAQVGEWILVNSTTGAYTLTAKTASGTGITLTQGQSTYAYSDGTNVYFADSSKVASFNGRVGTVSLNATDVTTALGYIPLPTNNPISTGVLLAGTTTNPIGALVASGTTGAGNVFGAVIGNGPGTGFLAQALNTSSSGFDFFGGWSSTGSRLFGVSGNGDVVGRSFGQTLGSSISGNGWTYLLNGLIVQWGVISVTPGAFISFPVTFPNNNFTVMVTDQNGRNAPGVSSFNTSGFYPSITSTTDIGYYAIGN